MLVNDFKIIAWHWINQYRHDDVHFVINCTIATALQTLIYGQ